MERSRFSILQRWGGTLLLSLTFLQSVSKALCKNSRIARETLFLLIFFWGGHISPHSSTLKTVTTGFSETSFSMVQALCYFPFILSHSFIFNLLNWQGTTSGFHGNWIPVAMGRNSCPTNLKDRARAEQLNTFTTCCTQATLYRLHRDSQFGNDLLYIFKSQTHGYLSLIQF